MPEEVSGPDFPDQELGQVSPDGMHDILPNQGWINVGISKDSFLFAVNAIRRWWYKRRKSISCGPSKLFLTADGSGSNGSRTRL